MAGSITHTFASAIADGADATLVRPSNWNAAHTFSLGTVDMSDTNTGIWGNLRLLGNLSASYTHPSDMLFEAVVLQGPCTSLDGAMKYGGF